MAITPVYMCESVCVIVYTDKQSMTAGDDLWRIQQVQGEWTVRPVHAQKKIGEKSPRSYCEFMSLFPVILMGQYVEMYRYMTSFQNVLMMLTVCLTESPQSARQLEIHGHQPDQHQSCQSARQLEVLEVWSVPQDTRTVRFRTGDSQSVLSDGLNRMLWCLLWFCLY